MRKAIAVIVVITAIVLIFIWQGRQSDDELQEIKIYSSEEIAVFLKKHPQIKNEMRDWGSYFEIYETDLNDDGIVEQFICGCYFNPSISSLYEPLFIDYFNTSTNQLFKYDDDYEMSYRFIVLSNELYVVETSVMAPYLFDEYVTLYKPYIDDNDELKLDEITKEFNVENLSELYPFRED